MTSQTQNAQIIIIFFLCSSLSERHKDQRQVLPGRARPEELPRCQRGLPQPGRRPRYSRIRRRERAAHRLHPPEHRPGRAGLAGRQRHDHGGLLGRPEWPDRCVQKLGRVRQSAPSARRRRHAELRRPVRSLRGQVAGRELPSGEDLRLPVQHSLTSAQAVAQVEALGVVVSRFRSRRCRATSHCCSRGESFKASGSQLGQNQD